MFHFELYTMLPTRSMMIGIGVAGTMLKAETPSTRAPRGSKPVSQAFFTALESIPEAMQTAVARAAQVMIRDELKARREKIKASAAKEKARKPAAAKAPAKATTAKKKPAAAAPAKTRARKQASVSSAA
jgi:ribosome-associated protein